MSNAITHEDILRELELLPVWRTRPVPIIEAGNLTAISDSANQPASESIALKTPVQEPAAVPVPETSMIETPMFEMPEFETSVFEISTMATSELLVESKLPFTDVDSIAASRTASIKAMDWSALQASIKDCQACKLSSSRTKTVFGGGDPQAEWLFVGDAPGEVEDQRGEPFAGQAGQLLDNMLIAMQLRRGQNVFIANALKCRPSEKCDPLSEEARQCDPYLKQQVTLIQPKMIVALGEFAAQSLLQTDAPIASLRGQVHRYNGLPVVVTFDPAYLLVKPEDKPKAWEDLCFARQTMLALQGQNS
jgi:uracil-DNA glycosylase family 4